MIFNNQRHDNKSLFFANIIHNIGITINPLFKWKIYKNIILLILPNKVIPSNE
jgi:hypothetical protein